MLLIINYLLILLNDQIYLNYTNKKIYKTLKKIITLIIQLKKKSSKKKKNLLNFQKILKIFLKLYIEKKILKKEKFPIKIIKKIKLTLL